MHNAPAVGFPVGRSRFQGMLIGFLTVCGALTMAMWCWHADAVGWSQWLGLSGCLIMSFWMGWQWWRAPVGHLSWDGAEWTWVTHHQSTVVMPEIALDFQLVLLLRLWSPSNSSCGWVWLDCAFYSSRWKALRRAIFDVVNHTAEPKRNLINPSNDDIRSER